MPTFQTGLQNNRSLVIGSVKAEVSATSSWTTTLTNVGLGRAFTITENVTQSNILPDNGDEPLEFITDHTATISFELLEFWLPTINIIRGGIDTASTTTVAGTTQQLFVGGKSKIAPRVWRFTNTILSEDGTTSYERVVNVISASIASGLTMAFGSDRAEDPAMTVPFELSCKLDTTRETTEGQLFFIEDEYGLSTA